MFFISNVSQKYIYLFSNVSYFEKHDIFFLIFMVKKYFDCFFYLVDLLIMYQIN